MKVARRWFDFILSVNIMKDSTKYKTVRAKGDGFGLGGKKKTRPARQCLQLHYFINISANFASNPKSSRIQQDQSYAQPHAKRGFRQLHFLATSTYLKMSTKSAIFVRFALPAKTKTVTFLLGQSYILAILRPVSPMTMTA